MSMFVDTQISFKNEDLNKFIDNASIVNYMSRDGKFISVYLSSNKSLDEFSTSRDIPN